MAGTMQLAFVQQVAAQQRCSTQPDMVQQSRANFFVFCSALPAYVHLLDLFHEVTYQTAHGQLLDTTTAPIGTVSAAGAVLLGVVWERGAAGMGVGVAFEGLCLPRRSPVCSPCRCLALTTRQSQRSYSAFTAMHNRITLWP